MYIGMFMFESSSTAMVSAVKIYIIWISYIKIRDVFFCVCVALYSGYLFRILVGESYTLAAYP
jgi:hypothetical protein